jgi:orotate phosphoribosyltransferase
MISVIPIVAANYNIDINAFSIRKERKNYGLFNIIEGNVKKNVPILLMDDLCNSTQSLQKAFHIVISELKETPFPATFTIVNKTKDNSNEKLVPEFLRSLSLFNLTDFNMSYDDYIQAKAERNNDIRN